MYNHKEIESKWQKQWRESKISHALNDSKKPKKYVLIEFPYPSGEGLHMGHLRPYLAGDVYSRYNRSQGFNTMFPIGWDAFGLPAENFAIKKGVHPTVSTAKNISNAKKQLQSWGMAFDWDREINTTDPEYYKWTQWIFLQFFKAGLAYEATGLINWCPKDKTGLANEEVVDGKCERCGTVVEKKELRQWYLKITAYAEKLLEGLKDLNWPERVKVQQENWIGKSEGAEIDFEIDSSKEKIKVFTTRPDTLFGATYMVLAPEHPLVDQITTDEQKKDVDAYVDVSKSKSEQDRTNVEKEKTGVFTGSFAINPATKEKIPVWIADYVLATYGTGAIMAVPQHDDRDREFAEKFNLPIVDKPLIPISEAINKFGVSKIQYKLRDWVFSRQRYWGEPIPLIHCEKCGIVPVPENELPVKLPDVEKYEPTGTGESPLAGIDSWVHVKCPKCGGDAKRETNTMPQWAGSSWYWLRYTDPKNDKEFADKKFQKYWTPVDVYFGGMEHTTLHLLYSRFWNLFLYDKGLVTVKEPYAQRVPHGIILGPDGEKMSKSRGNVVNPDEVVEEFGADTLRLFELFLGPHEATVSWSDQGIVGAKRFLDKVWRYQEVFESGKDNKQIHKLTKKITSDIENFKFNTAIAAFMEFLNENKEMSKDNWESFLILLSPFAPHITEELWSKLGHKDSIHEQLWPKFDQKATVDENVKIVVQVGSRVRATLEMSAGTTQDEVREKAMTDIAVKKHLEGKEIIKEVFVQDKLINFVIK
jgi:leucyl-tRNA synthetase